MSAASEIAWAVVCAASNATVCASWSATAALAKAGAAVWAVVNAPACEYESATATRAAAGAFQGQCSKPEPQVAEARARVGVEPNGPGPWSVSFRCVVTHARLRYLGGPSVLYEGVMRAPAFIGAQSVDDSNMPTRRRQKLAARRYGAGREQVTGCLARRLASACGRLG